MYDYRCAIVSRPSCFMTSAKMRLFWLPLSTMNCSGELFTHICEWKRRSPSYGFSSSWQWPQCHWDPHQWFSSLCHSPCRVLTQGQNMHLILKPSTRPPMTAWSDTHFCYEWDPCGTHTTFLCPSLASWCFSFLVASTSCLGSPCLGFVLCSSDLQIQSLASLFKLLLDPHSVLICRV